MKQKHQFIIAIVVSVIEMAAAICAGMFIRQWHNKTDIITDTFTVTDTITEWQHDTVYRYDTKVVKLPVHDTTMLTDSLYLTDSVFVEVPVYRYRYDTTLTDTNVTIRLQAALSGYEVSIDTLAVTTTITPIIIKEAIPWHKRFRPSVGIGIGTNLKGEATAGLYVGIGYLF